MAECILAKYGDIDVSEPPVPTEKTVSTSFRMNITTFNNKNYYPTFRLNLPTDYTYLAGWQLTSTDVTITTAKSGSGESNLKLGSYWYVTFKGSNLQSITQRDNFLDFSMGTRYTAPQTKLVGGTWGDLQSFARQHSSNLKHLAPFTSTTTVEDRRHCQNIIRPGLSHTLLSLHALQFLANESL